MTTDQNPDLRAQLLDALDFAYCQGLGYDSPEALLAAYDASCGAVPVPPPADQTALRDRIRRAICEAEGFGWDTDMLEPDEYGEVADAVLAVLPEQTALPLTAVERQFLTFALGLAADEMASRGSEFGEDDEAALEKLRRVAAEEQPAETRASEAHPPSHTWTVESPRRDNWASWGATYDDRDWAVERCESAASTAPQRPFRLVRATTTYTVEAEHTPPAVGEQPETQETRVVAYVLAVRTELHCLRCTPNRAGDIWTPVTSEELEDGGICTVCGVDVLIPQEANRG